MGVVASKGFEPLTPRVEVWCSIQLSYEAIAAVRGIITLPDSCVAEPGKENSIRTKA